MAKSWLVKLPRLIKYFDMRKEARTSEIDALGKAKAVLSGADYSSMIYYSIPYYVIQYCSIT